MKKILPNVTSAATSTITVTPDDTSDHEIEYLRNVRRLSEWFFTGFRYIQSPNIPKPAWRTIHEPLANGFVRKFVDPLSLLGVGFGENSRYIMFDVDRHSANHPNVDPRSLERLLKTLNGIGLTTPVIIRSSNGCGIHVYCFFKRTINTFRLASLASVTLINAKFQVRDGELEIFPNTKAFDDPKSDHKTDYNRHRLPIQPQGGGAICDRLGNPLMCGVNTNCETQLAAFLQMAEASANGNDLDKIERQLDPVYEVFRKNPGKYRYTHRQKSGESAKFTAWRQDTETVLNIGWTGFHQTNKLLYDFVVYGVTFLKISNENALFDWVFNAVTNADGYQEFCRHQHEIEARIWDWINYHLKKQTYVPYCGHPPRSTDRDYIIAAYKTSKSKPTSLAAAYTRERVEQTVQRMDQTVKTILATIANIPSRIGDVIKLLQATAREKFGKGFSSNTLHKKHYKYIWEPLLSTKKDSDMVLVTPITPTNMRYCPEILTENAFEGSIFDTSDLPQTTLKSSIGETSHPIPSLWSVDSSCRPSLAVNQGDPDLDPDLDLKNISLDPDSAFPNFASNLQSIQTDLSPDLIDSDLKQEDLSPDPIQPSIAELTSKSDADREQLIDPDPIDQDKSIQSIQPIHPQSIPTATFPNLITNPQSNLIEPPEVDLIGISTPDREQSRDGSINSSHPVPDPINLDPSDPDPIHSDPIHPVVYKNNDRVELLDIDDPEHQSTGVICAIIGSRAMVKWDVSRKLNTYPIANLTIVNPTPKKISEAQQIFLHEQKARYLAQLIPYGGCVVSTIDAQQVHGVVIAVKDLDVCVNWQNGSSGRYAIDELRCTHSPCINNWSLD